MALNIIEHAAEEADFQFSSIDITQDEELMKKFDIEIPVIEIDGEIAFKHKINKKKLLRILKS
ncbi:MAG: glutaredoxin family protein [Candidatus Marinimicrobia bacterium]|nr:glutaredoxin family protein [Candidatus Neomarinimicrobiota bacterium]